MRRALGCQYVDDPDRGRLRRRIRRQPVLHVLRIQRAVGGGEHDAAVALRLHGRPCGLRQPQRRLGRDRHHVIETILVHRIDTLVLDPACVVHDRIQAAVPLQDIGDQRCRPAAGIDAMVAGLDRKTLCMQARHRLIDPPRIGAGAVQGGAHILHHHVCTALCQQATVSESQSASGTGDQGNLPGKRKCVVDRHADSIRLAQRGCQYR